MGGASTKPSIKPTFPQGRADDKYVVAVPEASCVENFDQQIQLVQSWKDNRSERIKTIDAEKGQKVLK